MESLVKRRRDQASSREEDSFGVQPRRVADLAMVPNLRWSSTSLCRNRRSQYLFSNCEKVSLGSLGLPGPWLGHSDPLVLLGTTTQQRGLGENTGGPPESVSLGWFLS